MLEEPFWLGLMTIAVVMVLIGVVWCIKRHFAEKIDRFMSEELERGKLVEPALLEWPRGGRPPMQRLSLETNTTSRPASPQHNSKVSAMKIAVQFQNDFFNLFHHFGEAT